MPSRAIDSVANSLLSGVNWSVESDMFLGDFVERVSLPHLALVTKGQYLNVGAPNLANPNLKPYVLVHSRQKVRKVLANMVKCKGEGKRAAITEHRIAIPENYEGFFEILSEDGKPVKCIETVRELAKKFPELCLARGPVKAYLPDNDGELRNLYRSRQVDDGELLTLVGQFNFKRMVFLRCFDEAGGSVYFKMNTKAKFSPVARKDAITGVHLIRNLLDAKRFPLTVRLIQGPFPSDLKLSNNGPIVMRLQSVFTEDTVMFYVLQKDSAQPEFLSLPLNAHLKLASSLNHPSIVCRSEFRQLAELCEELLSAHLTRITPVHEEAKLAAASNNGFSGGPYPLGHGDVNPDTHAQQSQNRHQVCFVSNGDATLGTTLSGESSDQSSSNDRSKSSLVSSPELVISDEEIDQLYDYIRGLAPLPESCQPPSGAYKAPPPPPLETLPSRRSEDSGKSPVSDHALSPKSNDKKKSLSKQNSAGNNSNKLKEAYSSHGSHNKYPSGQDRRAGRSHTRDKSAPPAQGLKRDKSSGNRLAQQQYQQQQQQQQSNKDNDGNNKAPTSKSNGDKVSRRAREKEGGADHRPQNVKHLRNISRSTEKLLNVTPDNQEARRDPANEGNSGNLLRKHRHHRGGLANSNNNKPRPLSMVLPDNVASLYPSGSSPINNQYNPQHAAPILHGHFGSQQQHLSRNPIQGPMFGHNNSGGKGSGRIPSLTNLHISDPIDHMGPHRPHPAHGEHHFYPGGPMIHHHPSGPSAHFHGHYPVPGGPMAPQGGMVHHGPPQPHPGGGPQFVPFVPITTSQNPVQQQPSQQQQQHAIYNSHYSIQP